MSSNQEQSPDSNRALLELLHGMSKAADLERILALLLEGMRHLVSSDGQSVMWLDQDHLKVLASEGATAALPGLVLPAGQVGVARPVLDGGRTILVNDTAVDRRWQRIPGEEQVRSWLGAPLLLGERTLGLLEWTSSRPASLGPEAAQVASEVARLAAPLLHRAQLMDEMRSRLRELVSPRTGVAAAPDPSLELQSIVSEARESGGARHSFAFLASGNPGELRCAAAAGERREQLKATILRGDGSVGGWVIPKAQVGGRRRGKPSDQKTLAALGIGTPLTLPLRAKGQAAGILGIANDLKDEPLRRDAIAILTHLAGQASAILERAPETTTEPQQTDYEVIVQSSPLAVGVLTHSGDIRFCNSGLIDMLSPAGHNLVGHNLSEFVVEGDHWRLNEVLEEVSFSGQRQQVDVRLHAMGEQLHVRISLAVAHIAGDPAGNVVAILEDISSLKILEQERVDHLRELRERHNQLRELDQLKSRFVSNVSHELRTPLAVIKLYAALARKGRPEKQAHYLQTIEQETHRLETLVENVLDLTRIDRMVLQMNPELVDPEAIIVQVLQVYTESAVKKEIGLTNAVHGPLPAIWADKDHLVQMLTNLVDNALKYTPRGGAVWIATGEVLVDGRPMLEIRVSDTGTGIPEAEQEQVFERFYRGSNNPAAATGTGLGLAIVRELMTQHDGRVTLVSRAGEGSVFALQFPLDEERRSAPVEKPDGPDAPLD